MIYAFQRLLRLLDLPDQLDELNRNLGAKLSALDDALAQFADTARGGFSQLHALVDELRTAVDNAGAGADSTINAAAAKVVAASNDLEASFASFTQRDDVPVEPVPDPEPVPQPQPTPGDEPTA